MSAISLKSITGITSITTPAGVDNQLTLHNNNTTEAVKLDIAGNLHFHNHLNITGVSTASNFKTGTSNLHNTGLNVFDLDVDGHANLDNVSIAGVATATTFVGALTGTASGNPTLTSGANNRVVTATGANALTGEANFTYNGTQVDIAGTTDGVLNLDTTDSRGAFIRFGQGGSYHNMIGCADGLVAGPDKEDLGLRAADNMVFCTNGANERLRITSDGNIGFNRDSVNAGDSETETATSTPKRIVFNNDYSNVETDAALKIYLFNNNATRQGFTSGANFNLQYHSSGSSTHSKHTFYTQNVQRLSIKPDGNVTISNTTTSPSGDFRMLTLIARSDKQASIGFTQQSGVYSGATVTAGYSLRLAGDGALELATHNSNIIALKATQTGNVEMVGDLSTNNLSGRNIVINGDMRVAQRATSASMSNHGNDIPACDRWNYNRNGVTATVAQVAEAPAGYGFKYSLKWTSTSAVGSLHPGNALFFTYNIERQDIQRLGYGSSGGKKATLSFWAKGSLAGKIGMSCTRDGRIFSANVDMTANTWQHHTITIPADTSTGFSGDDNASGFLFRFCWGAGSNSTSGATNSWINFHNAYTGGMTAGQQGAYLTTNGSTFQITGVQLEIGSQSTPFEHRLISEELARCKRYYNKVFDMEGQSGEKPASLAVYENNSTICTTFNFPKMRVVPELDITNGTNKFMVRSNNVSDHFNTLTMRYGTTTTAELFQGTNVSGTSGYSGFLRGADTDVYIAFDAEL